MSEWWTYRPSDFLMFSPRIYWRLFQSINEAWWPAQALLLGAALAWLGRVRLGPRARVPAAGAALRGAALVLAACWAVVAWAFLLERFAPINWPARGYAVAFFIEAAGLLAAAATAALRSEAERARRWAGTALGLAALLGYPLLGLAFARPWTQAEVFGLAPDPTAVGTLGFLLLLNADAPRVRALLRALWIVPLGWCAVSAATLGTMGSAQAWLPLLAAAVAVAALVQRARG